MPLHYKVLPSLRPVRSTGKGFPCAHLCSLSFHPAPRGSRGDSFPSLHASLCPLLWGWGLRALMPLLAHFSALLLGKASLLGTQPVGTVVSSRGGKSFISLFQIKGRACSSTNFSQDCKRRIRRKSFISLRRKKGRVGPTCTSWESLNSTLGPDRAQRAGKSNYLLNTSSFETVCMCLYIFTPCPSLRFQLRISFCINQRLSDHLISPFISG